VGVHRGQQVPPPFHGVDADLIPARPA
jgi:hypothetical protein